MKTQRVGRSIWILHVSLLATLVAGCTHTYSPPKNPVGGFPTVSKIPLNVELRLSDELRAAKWESHWMGDTWLIPLGGAFTQNAEVVARELFSSVVVTNGNTGPAKDGVNAILTPRMVLVEQNRARWAYGNQVLTVLFEWTLADAQGNTVWVDTIKGESEEVMGTVLTQTSHGEKRVKELLEDLFRKSFQAMSSSPAIREFATTQRKVATR